MFFVSCYCGGHSACAWKMADSEQGVADLWNGRGETAVLIS